MLICEFGETVSDPSVIAMHDPVTCGTSHGPEGAVIWFADIYGNRVRLHVHHDLAARLHACWAATATPTIAQPTPRR